MTLTLLEVKDIAYKIIEQYIIIKDLDLIFKLDSIQEPSYYFIIKALLPPTWEARSRMDMIQGIRYALTEKDDYNYPYLLFVK